MSRPFAEHVSAVMPIDSDAIDGTPRPKPRRQPRERREPMDRSLTFFCSNPQCGHATWAPSEQARHMAREFWEVAQALVRLAPESSEAMKLTGGVILKDLSDDECRTAYAAWRWHQKNGNLEMLPIDMRLRYREYCRRREAGTLSPAGPRPRRPTCSRGHEWTEENTYRSPGEPGRRRCRECMKLSWESPELRERRNATDRQRWARLKMEDPDAYVRELEKMRRHRQDVKARDAG